MENFNAEEYRERCAKFLNFEKVLEGQIEYYLIHHRSYREWKNRYQDYVDECKYSTSDRSFYTMAFDTEWDWIFEIREGILNQSYVNDFEISKTGIQIYLEDGNHIYQPINGNEKEAVVRAIDDFLIKFVK